MDFSIYFEAQYRAGEAGYYEGVQHGECRVYHDSKVWVYSTIPKGQRRAFRHWVQHVWKAQEHGELVTGRYPILNVD